MGEQKPVGTGVVVVDGRNRVWVEKGAVHWRRGRRTTVVPGARVREVRRHEKGLSLLLTDDAKEPTPLTLRHRNPEVLAALAADIDAIIEDSTGRQPEVREDTTPSRLRRAVHAAGSRIAHVVRHGPPWQRCALAYVVLGAPIMLLIPVEPRTSGLEAWAMSLPGLALLGFWAHLSEFRTHLIVGWRGVTARAESTRSDTAEDDAPDYTHRFRTLDGDAREHQSHTAARRGEIRYDPHDPRRVVVPTRIKWLSEIALGFFLAGAWGVLLVTPLIVWLLVLPSRL
ncbi:hypothetical protein G3I60_36000 [Streptomyces sp. SID13666]|uniref:hypothetical protein n=1 Tax=unclassified Streptomyces TaxID=2593676 RepID=UPI0013C22C10|nr:MULTISPECIES: hypothetical protein [unclassified Streptomyces]NEA59422.1 hypothetical protein [Streptomyces sp. SID13666]NEA72458.1 hypothetical protein [Streptomyces sp. SID13588]